MPIHRMHPHVTGPNCSPDVRVRATRGAGGKRCGHCESLPSRTNSLEYQACPGPDSNDLQRSPPESRSTNGHHRAVTMRRRSDSLQFARSVRLPMRRHQRQAGVRRAELRSARTPAQGSPVIVEPERHSSRPNVGVDRHAAALRRKPCAGAYVFRRNAAACPRRTTC
jgi:hypothetical protein